MTLTRFEQLRSYWWDSATRKPKVKLKLRDFRARNFPDENRTILQSLETARKSEFFQKRFGTIETSVSD
jgi:hypothetical protein